MLYFFHNNTCFVPLIKRSVIRLYITFELLLLTPSPSSELRWMQQWNDVSYFQITPIAITSIPARGVVYLNQLYVIQFEREYPEETTDLSQNLIT